MEINKDELLANYFGEALKELKEIIKIKSFAHKPEPNAPFGQPVKQVLDYTINLVRSLGFKAYQDEKNRYGFFDYGSGDKTFVILCHLDVVPPGNLEKWITDPFNPIEQDGKLIGRGSFDDKGPTMMNIYALKYLKDHDFNPDYKIRVIFGLTEETTWESITSYVEDFGVGDLGYTPDGEFPVVYAEKWIADLDFVSVRNLDYELVGGAAYNVINDLVTYKGPLINEAAAILAEHNIGTKIDNDQLIVYGKAGHGSLPYIGINAATWAGYALFQAGLKDPAIEFLNEMHLNFDATNFIKDLTDETGSLTQNLGIIELRDGVQKIGVNYRIPVFSDVEKDVVEPFRQAVAKYGLEVKARKTDNSVYIPKDSPLIQKMMQAYQTVTGDFEAEPLAIGGGTYAKSMPNVVAFGAEFDLKNSTMHAYNESVPIEDLKKMLLIYTQAITLLTKN